MATQVYTISDFVRLTDDDLSKKKIYLSGRVVSETFGNVFTFADKSTAIDVKIVGKNHMSSQILKKDGYIKILKPGLQRNPNRVLLLATTVVLPTKKIPFVDTSELTMLQEPFFEDEVGQMDEPIPTTDVSVAQNLAPKQIIKKIVVILDKNFKLVLLR